MKPKLSDLWRWKETLGRGACPFRGVLIIHTIHLRALNHVEQVAEGEEA